MTLWYFADHIWACQEPPHHLHFVRCWPKPRFPANLSLSWSGGVGGNVEEEIPPHRRWLPGVDIEHLREPGASPQQAVLHPWGGQECWYHCLARSGEVRDQSQKSRGERNCSNNDSSEVPNQEGSLSHWVVDQPCLWDGSSREWLGALWGKVLSNIARPNRWIFHYSNWNPEGMFL